MTLWVQRLWPSALALLSLGYFALMLFSGSAGERTHLIQYQAKGVMLEKPEGVIQAKVTSKNRSVTFIRSDSLWHREGNSIALSEQLAKSLNLAVKFMHTAEPLRVISETELSEKAEQDFGLDQPQLSIILHERQDVNLQADFGSLSNDGFAHYMRIKGRSEVFLMSRFVLHEWQAVLNLAQ